LADLADDLGPETVCDVLSIAPFHIAAMSDRFETMSMQTEDRRDHD
jgi:hypothetical protein